MARRLSMMEILGLLVCLAIPSLLVGLLIWMVMRAIRSRASTPGGGPSQLQVLDGCEALVESWLLQGRLTPELAAQVRALVREDRLLATTPPVPSLAVMPVRTDEAVLARPLVEVVSSHPVASVQPVAAPVDRVPAPVALEPPAVVEPATPALPAPPAQPLSERLWAAILARRTRQTLLYVGAFLLVASALILVIFNWRNFSPFVQFALLAGVCGGLWGGGAWMARQPDLKTAGIGLQSVGGALTPIVAFALSRPGLLDLELRSGWLLAAIISVPMYVIAAQRLRQLLFAVAGCVTVASAVLIGVSFGGHDWLSFALIAVLALYLPLTRQLQRIAPELAPGPYWVAHGGTALALLSAVLLYSLRLIPLHAFALTLWIGAFFYLVAAVLEHRARWSWAAAVLAPCALLAQLLTITDLSPQWLPLTLLPVFAGYLLLAATLRARTLPHLAVGPYIVAHGGTIGVLVATSGLLINAQSTTGWLAGLLWAVTGFYLLALWLERQDQVQVPIPVTAGAAALLTPLALIASLAAWGVTDEALPVVAVIVLLGYLPLAQRFRTHNLEILALGPEYVAHAGVPLSLLSAGLFAGNSEAVSTWLGLTIWTCAAFYLVATWISRRAAWSWVAALLIPTALSVQLLSIPLFQPDWLPLPVLLLLVSYVPLAYWLRRRALPTLAVGPYGIAYVGLPVVLAGSFMLTLNSESETAFAATLWAGAVGYAFVTFLEDRARNFRFAVLTTWAVGLLTPLALLVTLSTLSVGSASYGLTLGLLAAIYFAIGMFVEQRALPYAVPAYGISAVLGGGALLVATGGSAAARWTLPFVIGVAVVAVATMHGNYLRWLEHSQRRRLGTAAVALAGMVSPAWLVAMLALTNLNSIDQALIVLPLAVIYFVLASSRVGRLSRDYDLVLQRLGVMVALSAGATTLQDARSGALGMTILTGVWTVQAVLRRRSVWPVLALGNGLLAVVLGLAWLHPVAMMPWIAAALALATAYLLAGTFARGTAYRYWTWPSIAWGTVSGATTLALVALDCLTEQRVLAGHVLVVLGLVLLVLLLTALWREPKLGWVGASLVVGMATLAVQQGVFANWQLTIADYSYVLCCLAVGLMVSGQVIRRIGGDGSWNARYAAPYEIVGFGLLTIVPLLAASSVTHATVTWAAIMILCGLAMWLYALPWLVVPALLGGDMLLLRGSGWLLPTGDAGGAGVLLLAATWGQALVGLWLRRQARSGRAQTPGVLNIALLTLMVALVSGSAALVLAASGEQTLTLVALALAALVAVVATVEQRREPAWGSLVLLALGLAQLHLLLALTPLWSMAVGVAEAFGLGLLGWGVAHWSRATVWREPLFWAPLISAITLTGLLLTSAPLSNDLQPLSFALATLGLLLAAVSTRERQVVYAYGAGAALIAAGLCQLAYLGFRQPQWYVMPAGVYLLAVAAGLRYTQQPRLLARFVEVCAVVMLVGTTLGQALRTDDLSKLGYTLWLCGEALLLLGYGTLRKLRVPFFGGAFFFTVGIIWLSADPIRAANKWMLLGALGLVLVGVYVLLERRQEQLARAGKQWADRISGWG